MLIGSHIIINSKNPELDRAFFKDVIKLDFVDVGQGWIIFGLPPAELAIHPAEENNRHEFYLMVEDIRLFVDQMAKHKIESSPLQDQRWGILTEITLPGGGKLGVYQPQHARPSYY